MPRLVTLGSLAVLDDDGVLVGTAIRGRNAALLAVLARAGDPGLTRERLASLFWPESDEARSRHSLDQAIYTVRRTLGDVFRSGATTVSLRREAIGCDVGDFADAVRSGDLERAVSLYAGPFLDGFHVSRASEFERWVDVERRVLEREYAEALEALARRAERDGESREAVRYRRLLLAARPLRPEPALALMRALDALNDRAGALEVAAEHRRVLRDVLDALPSPSIVAYAKELGRRPAAEGDLGGAHPADVPPVPRGHPAGPPPRPDDPSRDGRWVGLVGGRPRRGGRPLAAASVGILVAIVAVGSMLRDERGRDGGAPDGVVRPTVSVSPFQNETGDPAFTPLGSLAADWITEGLVRTGLVRVVDGSGSADAAISGRIYVAGDSVRLHARITSWETGSVLRVVERAIPRSADPAPGLQELRQRILGALGTLYDPRLARWTETVSHPPSYEAYQAFASGLEQLATPRDVRAAVAQFTRASRLDPEFVAPRLWTAWAWALSDEYERVDSTLRAAEPLRAEMSPLERAWQDRIRAVADGDAEASLRAARRMADIAPTSSWLLARASAALDANRPVEAIEALEGVGVRSLGPETGFGLFLLTAAYHAIGEYDAEVTLADEGVRAVGPNFGYLGPGVPGLAALGRMEELEARLDALRHAPPLERGLPSGVASLATAVTELRAHGSADAARALAARRLGNEVSRAGESDIRVGRSVVEILYATGDWEEAAARLPTLPDGRSEAWRLGMQGRLAARLGDRTAAREAEEALAATERSFDLGERAFWRASIEAALGNRSEALELLRDAFSSGRGAEARYWLHVSRDFDALRTDPEFERLVRPIG